MVVTYILVTIVLGAWYARRQKDTETYFVAGRSMGFIMVAALLFGELMAGAGTVGSAATAWRIGLSSVWANWGMAIGSFLFIIFVSKVYHAMGHVKGAMSVPEVFGLFFDNRSRKVLMLILSVVYFIIFSIQAPATAIILSPLFGTDYTSTVWVLAAMFIGITAFAGLEGVAGMNILNTIFMVGGMLIVAIKAITYAGGLGAIYAAVPPTYFSVFQPDLWTVTAQGLGVAIGCLASATYVTATFSADSLKTANRGIAVASIIVIIFALVPSFLGICASIIIPDLPANASLYNIAQHFGPIYGGIISLAILAVMMDSGATMLLVTTIVTRDLYIPLFPNSTDKQQLIFSRVAAIVLGAIGTSFGLQAGSILNQVLGAFQIRSVVGVVLLIALYWPRVSKDAAFYSMALGGIMAAVWHFTGNPFGVQPLWPSLVICLVVLIPMSLISKEKVSPGYKMYKEVMAEYKAKGLSK
jgi:Na+/proline symporter